MNIKLSTLTAASAALIALPGTAFAQAGTTYNGPFVGNTVTYTQVEDQDNLFGAPTITGDTLSFTPQGFNVESEGLDFDFEDGFLGMTITAQDDGFIDVFTLTEAGAFRLGGLPGVGTANTSVDVKTIFSITVLGTDNASAAGQLLVAESELFSADLAGGTLSGAWRGSTTVDIASSR